MIPFNFQSRFYVFGLHLIFVFFININFQPTLFLYELLHQIDVKIIYFQQIYGIEISSWHFGHQPKPTFYRKGWHLQSIPKHSIHLLEFPSSSTRIQQQVYHSCTVNIIPYDAQQLAQILQNTFDKFRWLFLYCQVWCQKQAKLLRNNHQSIHCRILRLLLHWWFILGIYKKVLAQICSLSCKEVEDSIGIKYLLSRHRNHCTLLSQSSCFPIRANFQLSMSFLFQQGFQQVQSMLSFDWERSQNILQSSKI